MSSDSHDAAHLRATLLLCQLRDFDSAVELLDPRDAGDLLALLASVFNSVVLEHGGKVMPSRGVTKEACFSGTGHAMRGLAAAAAFSQRWCERMQSLSLSSDSPELAGAVHTGAFLVFGEQTVAGTAAELARTLLAASRQDFLVSDQTLQACTASLAAGWSAEYTRGDRSLTPVDLGELPVLPLSPEFQGGVVVIKDGGGTVIRLSYWAEIKLRASTPPVAVLRLMPSPSSASSGGLIRTNTDARAGAIGAFGKYDLIRQLGAGGMGVVWHARDRFGNSVALKRLPSPLAATGGELERFRREAALMGRLSHRHIARFIEFGEHAGETYYAMECIDGVTLAELLHTGAGLEIVRREAGAEWEEVAVAVPPRLPGRFAVELIVKVASAVQYAHELGVLHRDLKPANIMVRKDGEPVVLDFGLARALTHQLGLSLSGSGAVLGSLDYMAPEQAEDSKHASERSDVFALGAVLYTLLTGRRAFEASGNLAADLLRLQDFEPPPDRAYPPAQPEDLRVIVSKCLAPEPSERYATAVAFRDDLERYLRSEPIMARPATLSYVLARRVRRHRRAVAALGAGLVILLLVSIAFSIRVMRERNRTAAALRDLQRTAPAFAAEAQHRLWKGDSSAALSKIDRALELAPGNREYRVMRANLLQSSLRLREAAAEYEHVVADGGAVPGAAENLALCKRLLARSGASPLDEAGKAEIADALISQGRLIEAAPLQHALGRDLPGTEKTLRALLKPYEVQSGWKDGRVQRLPNGTFRLDLSYLRLDRLELLRGMPISDLSLDGTTCDDFKPVAGLPLVRLSADHTRVRDLRPLQGAKLRWLRISTTPIEDLSPLSGMPLEFLDAAGCSGLRDISALRSVPLSTLLLSGSGVEDLEPIKDIRLRELTLIDTRPRSLEPLRGSQLVRLDLNGVRTSADLRALSRCSCLESLTLPADPVHVEALRALPKLRQITWPGHGTFSAATFWARFGAVLDSSDPAYVAIVASGVTTPRLGQVERDESGTLALNLKDSSASTLLPLAALPLRSLNISGTPVADLEPLRNVSIEYLDCGRTAVADAKPLAACPKLKEVVLPVAARATDHLPATVKVRLVRGSGEEVGAGTKAAADAQR